LIVRNLINEYKEKGLIIIKDISRIKILLKEDYGTEIKEIEI